MSKIKNIEYNNEYIEIETADKYIYKIPNDNTYIRTLLYKGIDSNKLLNDDIKYYDKCADICVYPIWIALGFLVYGVATKFMLLDLILIGSGGIAGLSLVGTSIFKIVSKKLKDKANNNDYFTKIYEYAKNGGKINNKQKLKTSQVTKTTEYAKTGKQIIQDKPMKRNQSFQNNPTKRNENEYHLNKNEIIQDEEIHQRKR